MTDRDITWTPLTEEEIAFFVPMGVQFWSEYKTGKVYISRRWWNGVTQHKRETVQMLIDHWRNKNANA